MAASAVTWLAAVPFWLADVLVLGLPLLYLLVADAEARRAVDVRFVGKVTVFCIVFFDYVGTRYAGWTGRSILLLPGGVPIEHLLWTVLAVALVLAVHRRFFARPSNAISVGWPRIAIYGLFFAGLAIALIPPLNGLMSSYVYLKIGLIIYPATLAVAVRVDRNLLWRILPTGLVFLLLNLVFELTALHNGYWAFQGDYVGWIALAGGHMPLEELLFIVAFSAPGILAVHELRTNWKRERRLRGDRLGALTALAVAAALLSGCAGAEDGVIARPASHRGSTVPAHISRTEAQRTVRAVSLTLADLTSDWKANPSPPRLRCAARSPWKGAWAFAASPSFEHVNGLSFSQAVGVFATAAAADRAFEMLGTRAAQRCFYRALNRQLRDRVERTGRFSVVRAEPIPSGYAIRSASQVEFTSSLTPVYVDELRTRVGQVLSDLVLISGNGPFPERSYDDLEAFVYHALHRQSRAPTR